MTFSRMISDALWWWRKRHPVLRQIPAWKRAADAEVIARKRGRTQDIGRARQAMRKAVLEELRRV